ncbi:MAG: PorT family protein [Sphingobacteriales bacterium JAD_PAG50586_3]|nr:MAG: PorT family protein [Sphingobacteriales bacterium JAD_PAG50586_3]
MKRIIAILVSLLLVLGPLSAQRREIIKNLPKYDRQVIHFGFILGMNTMNFVVKQNPNIKSYDSVYVVETQGETGFSLGIVSNLHIGNNLDLRFLPGLSFGTRNIEYTLRTHFNGTATQTPFVKKVESTILEFPLLMKFKSNRYGNMRAYIIGGGRYSLDLASQAKVVDEGKQTIKLYRSDYMWELGFGFDFYLSTLSYRPKLRWPMALEIC